MKVLIAEDDAVSARILHAALVRGGHDVDLVADGDEAWRRVRDGDVRLIISDWMMPGIDGIELCRRVRSLVDRPYVFIILLTGRSTREDRLAAMSAGADDFLAKPLDRAELAARLRVAGRVLAMEQELLDRAAELERAHRELQRQNARLAELATTDGLTGLANHRYFRDRLAEAASAAARDGRPLSVAMLDVDQFKPYNDTFGHPAGDAVLVDLARLLLETSRAADVVARYGGEEFVVLLPATDALAARAFAERARLVIASHPWPLRAVTASIGVATVACPLVSFRPADLIDRADRALYHSKRHGRDRVTHHDDLLAAIA